MVPPQETSFHLARHAQSTCSRTCSQSLQQWTGSAAVTAKAATVLQSILTRSRPTRSWGIGWTTFRRQFVLDSAHSYEEKRPSTSNSLRAVLTIRRIQSEIISDLDDCSAIKRTPVREFRRPINRCEFPRGESNFRRTAACAFATSCCFCCCARRVYRRSCASMSSCMPLPCPPPFH